MTLTLSAAAFDPWTGSLQEAVVRQEHWKGQRGGPLFQHIAAQHVLALQQRINEGDGVAVLSAVASCALEDLVMPDWLAREYLRRWRLVTGAQVATWDEAFGALWPKGTKAARLAIIRRHRLVQVRLFNRITSFVQRHPTEPIDWETLAGDEGVSKTVAQDLYYEFARQHSMTPSQIRASQGWPSSPAKLRKLAGRQRRS